jgi:hypothetical protein
LHVGYEPWQAMSKMAGRIQRRVEIDDIEAVGATETYKLYEM